MRYTVHIDRKAAKEMKALEYPSTKEGLTKFAAPLIFMVGRRGLEPQTY